MEQQKLTLVIPVSLREKIDAERSAMSKRMGCDLSLNQAAQSLLQRALENSIVVPAAG